MLVKFLDSREALDRVSILQVQPLNYLDFEIRNSMDGEMGRTKRDIKYRKTRFNTNWCGGFGWRSREYVIFE